VMVVLDASAILAWLQDETGAAVVDPLLLDGLVSVINWSEVLQKTAQRGGEVGETAELLQAFGVSIVENTRADAELAARLWEPRRALSLTDRFCLALGIRLEAEVITAEKAWTDHDYGVDVTVIR
jgi:ribonuclease VapC